MYLSGKFWAKKLSLKTFKNAETASNICFPCSERLIFEHLSLWFTLRQLTWSDLFKSAKC